jgi:hypothetical protein
MKAKQCRECIPFRIVSALFIGMTLMLMTRVAYANDSDGAYRIEITRTTVTNLDFNQVQFAVFAPPEFHKRLHDRAIDRLRKAGIYKADPISPIATLKLNLNPRQLNMPCPGKLMYEPVLALVEKVVIKRNPEIEVWADTWLLTQAPHLITEPVKIDRLEKDLDEYIAQFIIAYKMGNQSKK